VVVSCLPANFALLVNLEHSSTYVPHFPSLWSEAVAGTTRSTPFMATVVPSESQEPLQKAVLDPAAASSLTGFKRLVSLRLPDEFSATVTTVGDKVLNKGSLLTKRLSRTDIKSSESSEWQEGYIYPRVILLATDLATDSVPVAYFVTVRKPDASAPKEPKLKTNPEASKELEQYKSNTLYEEPKDFWNTAHVASVALSDGHWGAFVRLYDGLNTFVPKDLRYIRVQQSYQKLSEDVQKKRQEELKKIMKQFL